MLGIVPGLVPDTDKLGAMFSIGSAFASSHTWDIIAFSAGGRRLPRQFSSGSVNSVGTSKPMSPVRGPMSRGERVSTNRPLAWHCLCLFILISRERRELSCVHCGHRDRQGQTNRLRGDALGILRMQMRLVCFVIEFLCLLMNIMVPCVLMTEYPILFSMSLVAWLRYGSSYVVFRTVVRIGVQPNHVSFVGMAQMSMRCW